ncbi:MAG: DUF3883 domain-containing protein [Acidobacteria bacterium]|nr:DUF3883 domain-containing protein [Acidobacteriota bacterium]
MKPYESPYTEDLNRRIRAVLRHAVAAYRDGNKVYESLRNLNDVIGTEYGDRVLYELIQNAHDAHRADDQGRIAVRLVVRSESDGTLYVANGGGGFRTQDVDAIVNLATTAKAVGEGIGNKGLGFRSVGALTDDVRIFSRAGRSESARFDGYCFRFATVEEIEDLLRADHIDEATARAVAATVPRYLVPRPLAQEPDDVMSFARRGYASTIVVPLRTVEAIDLARRQVQALADLDVPLLLFLDRIAEFRIDMETADRPIHRRRLSRRQTDMGDVPGLAGCRMLEVRVGEDRRFLVVQREVDKELVLNAVKHSVPRAPQIERWLDWKGQPTVSVSVGLSPGAIAVGRLYNFLPMGDAAGAPLLGHLDAPFFAEIDRRNADFDLPLNATLLKAAAEACAHAALHLAREPGAQLPQRAAFDLVAWTGEHAGKLDTALDGMGSSLRNAPVVPAIAARGGAPWTSLSEASVWPAGKFSLMRGSEVSKRTGARLVSAELDGPRLKRLRAMAQRQDLDLSPSTPRLAEWSERFARSLADQNAAARTWIRFYDDVRRVFDAAGKKLGGLAGKAVFLDRSKKLRPAGSSDAASERSVFVRGEASRRRRAKDGVPLPPSTLARRYRFLDEKVVIRPDTMIAFVKAGLVREYDPLEALAGLGTALGANANDSRRQEALTWAFSVWRTAGAGIQEALKSARLRVPTSSGWRLATRTAFSSTWTSIGVTLETFLVEASDTSPDCRRARDALLVNFADWPASSGSKRQWITFLTLLGVADGLRPVAGRVKESGSGWSWKHLVDNGDSKEALDRDWCREASAVSFPNPYTEYRRRGWAWRLPGQIEHGELSETARQAFHELAFRHLDANHAKYLTFTVGRFERAHYYWNKQTLPTPLATFLRSKAWIAAGTYQESGFRKASQCWASRTRQGRPPRFLQRVSDTVAGVVEGSEELADLVFGRALGLRDWHSPETAPQRLRALADVAPTLAAHDRRDFRNGYRRAWLDLSNTDAALPPRLDLAVIREGRFETLCGNAESPPTVIVTENAGAFEARILSSAGHALLDIGEAACEKIVGRLAATGRFTARQLDGIDVRLLVDGEPFVPRTSDPPLTSFGLGWLPEVVLLGHEILADRLERGVHRVTVERRLRTIRVRRCQTITLVVEEEDSPPQDSMEFYGVEHPDLPTLILSPRVPLAWRTLARDLSRTVARLIDPRLRFLEPLLLRLALDQDSDTLEAPGDEALTAALGCDSRTVQDLRAALRTDLGHVLHLLMPVVAYFTDAPLAEQLKSDAERAGAAFDLLQWLRSRFPLQKPAPQELIAACGQASDRAALRKELHLDYARFNAALQDLGESPLSNESELRSVYEAYVRRMGPRILERLRRRHAADFRQERDLAVYVSRKTLAFVEFDPAWVLTRETLDNAIVEAHVARLLDDVLGEDQDVPLPSWRGLVDRNRKSVRDFASSAISVVLAWCRRNRVHVPAPWTSEDPQSVTRHLENTGLLDFEPVQDTQIPGLCHRAACWPNGMPQSLEPTSLGLDQATVEEEKGRRERDQQRRIIERRSIDFAGTKLDTADPSFAEALRQLAASSIADDDSWIERSSSRPRLAAFTERAVVERRSGGGTSGTGRRKLPPEHQRQAMGLASEWLALQYLRRRHGEAVDETCWVSTNRAHFYGGDEGDDSAGYDFCVKTPQAEWLYEVKSSMEDTCEFELTPNEMRVAASVSRRSRRRYRILYVPYVFSPDRWLVSELPNPMGDETRGRFKQVGHGSVRFRFERSGVKQTARTQ